jgi:hypothetical protein
MPTRTIRAVALVTLVIGLCAGPASGQSVQTIPQSSLGLVYVPLTFNGGTFVTGIRGDTITGAYGFSTTGTGISPIALAGSLSTATTLLNCCTLGLIYSPTTQIGTPFPVNTPSNANFPVAGHARTGYGCSGLGFESAM